ncbi:hypothetical protein POVCU2_0063390 [Plasmodium ovale curtisi]|uniref:Uncharacterized protein n=1 Tax=Plasmodium ovale curtisi TaxID=864141 RepID=A0A1A8WFC8_PLAOA|nr:hypothetical protein POVCU2_0063390 [Plasmodium ovale curtisi]
MLGLTAEQCKSYADMASKFAALPQGIADLCECIGNTDSTNDEQPKSAIKEILQKLGSMDKCDIKLSQYTEKITKALDFVQATTKTTLKYSGAFNCIVVLGEKLLRNIYKGGSCLCFGSRKKKGNKNYDEEMQNLYEEYNQTLQSTAMLNKYLLGYQQG